MTSNTQRRSQLTTADLYALDIAVLPLIRICDGAKVYLVGTVNNRKTFRDVDIRMILPDDEFDRLFGQSSRLWEAFCFAVSRWLRADTGLPIDFQVQRQTEANANHSGTRNPLTGGRRRFAGLGDATPFNVHEPDEGATT